MLTGSQLKRAGEAALGVNAAATGGSFWIVLIEGHPEAAYAAMTESDRDAIVGAVSGIGETPVVVEVAQETRDEKNAGRITVTVEEDGKAPVTFEAGGDPGSPNGKTDALFFSVAAVEKFLLPYYTQLYGPEHAQQIRNRYLGTSGTVLGHIWPSFPFPPDSDISAINDAVNDALG